MRTDPYELADVTSNSYYDWMIHRAYLIFAAQSVAGQFVETFKDFPLAQHPGSFTIDLAMSKMSEATSGP